MCLQKKKKKIITNDLNQMCNTSDMEQQEFNCLFAKFVSKTALT